MDRLVFFVLLICVLSCSESLTLPRHFDNSPVTSSTSVASSSAFAALSTPQLLQVAAIFSIFL